MAEGLIVLNVRGEILTINQSARKIFNLGSEDHIGEYVLTLQRSTELMDVIKRAGSGEAAGEIMHANGRVLQLLGSPVIESGMITGIVLLILDVTERTEAEASRREFTANVSHELKTPLTAIMGYAELMKSGMIPKEDMLKFSDRIYAAAQRLLQLVEDIIHLSRLDEGAPVESEDVDLSEIAEEVCNRLRPNAEAAGLTLTLDASNVTVEAVVHMVDELTANLVDNAIKYNRPNGSITVRVQSEPEGGSITVSDTGIGIAPEHQDRIFERFYRVDKSRSKEIGGTGLGLSIVKHIAAYHHAKISIQSRVGEGTSISVLFPDNLPKDLSE